MDMLKQLFLDARTQNGWKPGTIDDATLKRLFELTRMPPTAGNCQPARFVFVRGAEAKAKLLPCVSSGNAEKTRDAPVTVIVAVDREFQKKMPKVFPHFPQMFDDVPPAAHEAIMTQSGNLQAGYLILAARALGLDCGPMGGFDRDAVNKAFFEGTTWRSLLLVNLGQGDPAKLFPRNPRLDFDEACRIL